MLLIIALVAVPMLFGLYAQMRVSRAYSKNLKIASRGNITGREAAAAVMESAGIHDIEIVEIEGHLSDHFDPINKRLALSSANYRGSSLAALGVSAHEAGHAIQQKVGYSMMKIRQTLVPATQIAAGASNFLILAGVLLISTAIGGKMLMIGVNLGILSRDEMEGVNETLDAAALTYVAAFVASLGSLLHILLMLTGSRRDD